ncbi:MATE efflux family protein [Apiospora rasikravindrae]|uniref:MATE efflux family protein n=1 Tax=Apiospora rasikravindrae TaxID=990691 RepID=A0ABR1TZQ2_9PEZI
MSNPKLTNSDGRRDGRRDDPAEAVASSWAPSFRATSPIAHEILAHDLAEDREAGIVSEHSGSNDTEDVGANPTLYRPPAGMAFGDRRPVMLPEPVDGPVLTRVEKKQSRNEEEALLRDNHLLGPDSSPDQNPGLFTRAYQRLFGDTKVQSRVTQQQASGFPEGGPSETSPLLTGSTAPGEDSSDEHLNEQWEAAVASGKIHTTWQREAKTITVYSLPLIVTFVLQYSINISGIFSVGHIGKIELGAVSLATMTANITCYAPFQGLTTSLDTLCSQAYGSGHKHLVGLQFQRMIYFLWALTFAVAVVWFFAEDILLLMIPDPRSAELAGLYLRIMIAGIPGFCALECGKRFVQSQGLFHVTTYVLIIAAPLNVLMQWLFVWKFEWGFKGAPIAVVVTQNLMPVLLFLYVRYGGGMQCWGGFSKRALTNWGPMIKLALPGMIMVLAEWFAFEILTLASSQFGTSYLAAQSCLMTLTSTTFQIPFPLSIAASTRLANLIGAKLADAAKTSAKVAFFGALMVALFNVTLLSSLRYKLPLLFTSDKEVIELVATIMPLVAVMQLFDGMAAMAHGLLRGIGRQHFGGYANLLSYYLVALPISFGLAFGLDWRLEGLWIGVTIGLVIVATVEYVYIWRSDWDQSIREAEDRNASA